MSGYFASISDVCSNRRPKTFQSLISHALPTLTMLECMSFFDLQLRERLLWEPEDCRASRHLPENRQPSAK
ncbi:hypothetical protein V8E54_015199 [Elaphomyces granulatus]